MAELKKDIIVARDHYRVVCRILRRAINHGNPQHYLLKLVREVEGKSTNEIKAIIPKNLWYADGEMA